MARIAVVEDEAALRADVVEYLSDCGHHVVAAADGRDLDGLLAGEPPDIVILDINLPGEDGFSIAKRLRERTSVGIIMLTARSLGVDRVVGLEMGADAYLVKPVDLRELEAQVKALLRRLGAANAPADAAAPPSAGGEWVFDETGWLLHAPGGGAMKLTANERVLMGLLASNPGEPVTRNHIFQALGKRQWAPGDRSIDSMVRRIRAKAEETLGHALPLESVHGLGYAFTAPIKTC